MKSEPAVFVAGLELARDLLEALSDDPRPAWLAAERRLALNPKRWDVEPGPWPFVYLGFRVSRGGIEASKKLRRRMKARLRRAAARGPEALARTEASYRGLLLFG